VVVAVLFVQKSAILVYSSKMPKLLCFFRDKTRYAHEVENEFGKSLNDEGCDMNVPALHLPPLEVDSVNIPPPVQHRLASATQEIVARGWYMTASATYCYHCTGTRSDTSDDTPDSG
jgi:hypothetical protein